MSASSGDPAILLEGVGKRYRQYGEVDSHPVQQFLQRLGGRKGARDMWALRDLSFTLERGQTMGVIGRNGSGKTTLLRLLSGVSAPTEGHLRVAGRIAPLIGVGVGFNAELSGRENIYINGQLLGMSEGQLKRDFDSIVDFSEIEAFIETPVKFYSSGMFLRLAFAVIVHMHPEILVIDEVLAVGDMAFQLKCNDRIRAIRDEGATIVIVTHNLQMLPRMTERTIVLSHGNAVFDGPVEEALGYYQRLSATESVAADARSMMMREGPSGQEFVGGAEVEVELANINDKVTDGFVTGEPISIRIKVDFATETVDPRIGILVAPVGRGPIFFVYTQPGDFSGTWGPGKPLTSVVKLDNPLLADGYTVTIGIGTSGGTGMLGNSPAVPFHVTSRGRAQGLIDLMPQIEVDGQTLDMTLDRRNLIA